MGDEREAPAEVEGAEPRAGIVARLLFAAGYVLEAEEALQKGVDG